MEVPCGALATHGPGMDPPRHPIS